MPTTHLGATRFVHQVDPQDLGGFIDDLEQRHIYAARRSAHANQVTIKVLHRGRKQEEKEPQLVHDVMVEEYAFTSTSFILGTSALRGTSLCPVPSTPRLRARATGARMAFTSIGGVLTEPPVTLPSDIDVAVSAVYKQVFGNAHIMESELAEFKKAESQFRIENDVREFVRAVAKSDTYRARFFDPVSAYRSVELLFKHLLGRAPRSKEEYGTVMGVMQKQGFDKCIDWFVDSDEYEEAFGMSIVPYGMYRGMYPTNEEFNRAVAMRGTPSSSDKKRATLLQYAVCSGDSPSWLTVSKNLPSGTEKGTGYQPAGRWTSTQRNKNTTVKIGTKIPGGVVFYDLVPTS